MPFLHANNIFTITFEDDLAFAEVRSILDQLLQLEAFCPEAEESGGYYDLEHARSNFRVWVSDMEVIIQRHPSNS